MSDDKIKSLGKDNDVSVNAFLRLVDVFNLKTDMVSRKYDKDSLKSPETWFIETCFKTQ